MALSAPSTSFLMAFILADSLSMKFTWDPREPNHGVSRGGRGGSLDGLDLDFDDDLDLDDLDLGFLGMKVSTTSLSKSLLMNFIPLVSSAISVNGSVHHSKINAQVI